MIRNREYDFPAASKVLRFAEVAEAAGISISTLRREIARGNGPEVVVLSPRRKGVRIDDYRRWLARRILTMNKPTA
jgi:predicted DNA-binding transcriptional regulator AlpA